jgi:hypothetical protein
VGDLLPLRLRARITGQGATKPAEILEALLGLRELPLKTVRVAMGLGGLSPMSLEAVRQARRLAHDEATRLEAAPVETGPVEASAP